MSVTVAAAGKLQKKIHWNRPSLSKKELVSVLNCLIEDEISYGRIVKSFENEFARTLHFRHSVATNSLTAAYHLAFSGLVNSQTGAEVIASTLAPLQVADAARLAGLALKVIDTDRGSFMPSVDQFITAITDQTRFIIIEHKFGSLFGEVQKLQQFIKEKGLDIHIIEDISAVLGREHEELQPGHLGKIAVASLDVDQQLTIGRGAVLAMSDPRLFGTINSLRTPGQRPPGEPRFDYNISDIQAAMGLEQLSSLTLLLERRNALGRHLFKVLRTTRFESWFNDPAADSYLSFPVVTGLTLERIERFFKSQQIEIRRICEQPLHHLQELNRMDFPNAEKLWLKAFQLPCYPNLSKAEVQRLEFALRSLY